MPDRIFSVSGNSEARDEAFDLLEQSVEAGLLKHYDIKSEETLQECLVCDSWEEHKDGCPIPVIEKWLNEGPKG